MLSELPNLLAQGGDIPSAYIYIMQGFAGLSKFSVFLLMALGMTIIFGQMKVINMAHGEFMMLGGYVTVLLSDLVTDSMPGMLSFYLPIAMIAAFVVTFFAGYLVEFGLVRFLYKRPLDTLLATWGLGMIMQQAFRMIFGARADTARMPDWLMGSWQIAEGLDIPKNGIMLLALAIIMTFLIYLLMFRSRWGLRVRATVQNRPMANAVGINTKMTDRLTFALGCGLAGIAGCAFTTIGSVEPNGGTSYIVNTFLVVVFGGAGSLVGTIISAFSIAQVLAILEFLTSGVLATVYVLLLVIIILMIRPSGLVVSKIRK